MNHWVRVSCATVPGLVLAAFSLVHPTFLGPSTAVAWWQLHIPLVVLFPLLSAAVWVLLRGEPGGLAVLARIGAYLYGCLYIALDCVSGIAAGLATDQLGDTPLVGDLFSVGDPLGHLGIGCLAAATVLTGAVLVPRDGWLVVPGVLIALVAAWGFYLFHIFSPYGGLSMLGYAVGFGLIAAARRVPATERVPTG